MSFESTAHPFSHLHHNYERQRDVLFISHNLHLGQRLGPKLFQSLWDEVFEEGYEHLFVETIVLGEVVVVDPIKALTIVGDIGAKVFMYYGNLEIQLHMRRSTIVQQIPDLVPRARKM